MSHFSKRAGISDTNKISGDKSEFEIEAIIISYNSRDITLRCIQSMIEYSGGLKLGITVVDNASSDDTVAAIQTNYPDVRVIVNNKNLGYAAAVNIGAEACDAPFLLISNSDVFYHEDSIRTLYEYIISDPEIALTGLQQEYPDGSWQYSFGYLPGKRLILNNYLFLNTLISLGRKILFKLEMSHDKPKSVEYIDGAVHFVRKADFDSLGGFDEDY
ncbi:MAG: glycosyltransferase, partial [Chlorobi bacterium]|nr:glycosyltransferase [Chlorobiota bacterium]